MVNEELVRNTIQKMRDAGLSDTIISSTLSDLGLSVNQVQSFLAGPISPSSPGRSSSPVSSAHATLFDENEAIASRTSEKIVQHLEERNALSQQEAGLKDTITHVALEQHGEQLKGTHDAVMELHDKFDSTNIDTLSNRVSTMNNRLEQLSNDMIETKAVALALQSLLQKILEANQQLLFEMKNKK